MPEKGSIYFTGETGFIGRHLMAAIDRNLDGNGRFAGYGISQNHYVIATENDVIIHLAAVTHTRQEFDPALIKANYILTNNIFNSKARIIFASSCSARHDSSPYAQSKMYAEHLGAIHGNALGLRFFNVYGSGNSKGIIKYLMDQPDGAKITIRGENLIRDYIHVSNIVDYILKEILLPDNKSGIYDVGTGVGTSTLQLLNLYTELSGKVFHVECTEALPSDPPVMVANQSVPNAISLEPGLKMLING